MTTATAGPLPLVGFTVGVTAARRRDELTNLLKRRGARVVEAPTMRIIPLEDDRALRRATERCLEAPLDYVVATTGIGWRGWMSAADGWGRGAALADACRHAVVLTRGPKATGAVRATGLGEAFSPDSEAVDGLLIWLLARDLKGRRIAVQEHGMPLDSFAAALRERGAEVIEVPVYRWAPTEEPDAVRRLVELSVRREVHALTFTSAPAAVALLEHAEEAGLRGELLAALRSGEIMAACVGAVCARPLIDLGIPALCAERGRLGSLVRTVTDELPQRNRRQLRGAGIELTLQGSAVLVRTGDAEGAADGSAERGSAGRDGGHGQRQGQGQGQGQGQRQGQGQGQDQGEGQDQGQGQGPDQGPDQVPGAVESYWLTPNAAALLRALAERPGWVVSRADLLRRVWAGTGADEHAVEAAVARLRSALGPWGRLVRTVPKRGYRLELTA